MDLEDARISKFEDGVQDQKFLKEYFITSKYDHEKLTVYSKFRYNASLDLVLNYKTLQKRVIIKTI